MGTPVIRSSGHRKSEEEAMKICARKQDSKLPCSTEEHKGEAIGEADFDHPGTRIAQLADCDLKTNFCENLTSNRVLEQCSCSGVLRLTVSQHHKPEVAALGSYQPFQ